MMTDAGVPAINEASWQDVTLVVTWTPSTDHTVGGYVLNVSTDGGTTWRTGLWVENPRAATGSIPGLDTTKDTRVRLRVIRGSAPSAPVTVTGIAPPPPPPPSGMLPGIVTGSEPADFTAMQTLGAKLARVEFSLGDPGLPVKVHQLATQLATIGVKLQPLFGFAGRVPSIAEAQALGKVAEANPGMRFEFGNETSYGYQYGDGYKDASYQARARVYAMCVKAAAEVCASHGVEILCQAEDGGSGSSTWVDQMFGAVPDLAAHVGGWVGHFYPFNDGPGKLQRMIRNLAVHGATTQPIDITEFGIQSDDGAVLSDGTHVPYSEAAAVMTAYIAKLTGLCEGRERSMMLYQVRDQKEHHATSDREAYFGALTHTGGAKGAYTPTVQHFLAS